MRHHPDQETLATTADPSGASVDPAVADHVAACARCAADVAAYHEVAALVRARATAVPPPAHVWAAIEAAISDDGAGDSDSATAAATAAATPVATVGGVGAVSAERPSPPRRDSVTPVTPMPPARPARVSRARRWLPVAAAAAIGAVVGAAVVGVVTADDDQGPVVVAEARLDALPASPGASGSARLLGDGSTSVVEIDADLPASDGFYEVWLTDDDLGRMYSIGVLDGAGRGRFTLPPGGVGEFRTIDVSAEPLDGDPAHSTASVLRADLG